MSRHNSRLYLKTIISATPAIPNERSRSRSRSRSREHKRGRRDRSPDRRRDRSPDRRRDRDRDWERSPDRRRDRDRDGDKRDKDGKGGSDKELDEKKAARAKFAEEEVRKRRQAVLDALENAGEGDGDSGDNDGDGRSSSRNGNGTAMSAEEAVEAER